MVHLTHQEALEGTGRSFAALRRATDGLSVSAMLRTGLDHVNTTHHTGTASRSDNWLLGGAQLGIRRAVVASNTTKQSLLKPLIAPKQVKKLALKANVIYLFTGSNTPYESHV